MSMAHGGKPFLKNADVGRESEISSTPRGGKGGRSKKGKNRLKHV